MTKLIAYYYKCKACKRNCYTEVEDDNRLPDGCLYGENSSWYLDGKSKPYVKKMFASDLIKNMEYLISTHGDMPIFIEHEDNDDVYIVTDGNKGFIISKSPITWKDTT